MKQSELDIVIEKHGKWLRGEEGGVKADLRRANLYKADLREADLREADLYKASLRRANLDEANLHRANLKGADLYKASLEGASLRGANLEGADLTGANLEGANLERVNLEFAKGVKTFQLSQHFAYLYGERLAIGCKDLTLKEWGEGFQAIGMSNNYSETQIKEYKTLIDFCEILVKLNKSEEE